MKKILTVVTMLFSAVALFAQDYMKMSEALDRLGKEDIAYVGKDKNKLDIQTICLSIAKAYPTWLLSEFEKSLTGSTSNDASGKLTVDKPNGYCSFTYMTEISQGLSSCFWKMPDGTFLIGFAFGGVQEGSINPDRDEVDPDTHQTYATLNSLFFFTFKKGDSKLRHVKAEDIMGQRIDYRYRDIQLPRYGKNIIMIYNNGSTEKKETYKWNNGKFF